MRKLIAEVARDAGYEVEVAETADAAMLALQAQRFSLVLADWNLPGMSGLELCRTIRQRDHAPVVVIVSARATQADRALARAAGASGFLAKPFGPDALLDVFRSVREPSAG